MKTPKTPKRETNEQFIARMMNYSKGGALMQMFILQCLDKYAEAVAAASPESLETGMISGKAWHACAVELKAELGKHLDLLK